MNELNIRIDEVKQQIISAQEKGEDYEELAMLLEDLEAQRKIIDSM